MKFVDFIMFSIVFHEKLGEISEIHLIFHLFLVKIRENVNFRQINPRPLKIEIYTLEGVGVGVCGGGGGWRGWWVRYSLIYSVHGISMNNPPTPSRV